MTVYPNRGSIPTSLWHSLFDNAVESIDVLAFAASFLHDTMPDVDDLLIAKARAGVRVRLAFGDPDSEAVRIRGVEEGIGESLAERCRLTWKYLDPILAEPEISVRAHSTALYCSMFRFDDDLLANHHLLGAPANHSPVLHVRRGGRLFDHHLNPSSGRGTRQGSLDQWQQRKVEVTSLPAGMLRSAVERTPKLWADRRSMVGLPLTQSCHWRASLRRHLAVGE